MSYPVTQEVKKISPLPLSYQLKEIIREEMLNGNFKPGDRLPSERILCDIYKVSGITVQRALEELELENLVIRKQGLGSFVSQKKIKRQLGVLMGFTEDMHASGHAIERIILKTEVQRPSKAEVKNLRLGGDDLVVFVLRLIKDAGRTHSYF